MTAPARPARTSCSRTSAERARRDRPRSKRTGRLRESPETGGVPEPAPGGCQWPTNAHAVMCIDAIQFSDPPVAALQQCRRILARGGRLAITAWEPCGPVPEGVPERIRRMNLARDLAEAGFEKIE